MSLKFPRITEELKLPVQSLARAAFLFRGVFLELADGRPLDDIVAEEDEFLELADVVLNGWISHLGLDNEDLLEPISTWKMPTRSARRRTDGCGASAGGSD